MTEPIHDAVRDRYARSAIAVMQTATPSSIDEDGIGASLYADDQRAELPEAAVLASLGCGNPTAVADLHPGERVLDLGSGGGIDVLLSAKRVGPTGRAFGVDMTDEMLALARQNAAEAGATNVEFLKGTIEAIPLPADSIDVVISNCVITSRQTSRRCSGDRPLLGPAAASGSATSSRRTTSPRSSAQSAPYVGCIAGALSFAGTLGLAAAVSGTRHVTPTLRRRCMHSAIIRAASPPRADRAQMIARLTWARPSVADAVVTAAADSEDVPPGPVPCTGICARGSAPEVCRHHPGSGCARIGSPLRDA